MLVASSTGAHFICTATADRFVYAADRGIHLVGADGVLQRWIADAGEAVTALSAVDGQVVWEAKVPSAWSVRQARAH